VGVVKSGRGQEWAWSRLHAASASDEKILLRNTVYGEINLSRPDTITATDRETPMQWVCLRYHNHCLLLRR